MAVTSLPFYRSYSSLSSVTGNTKIGVQLLLTRYCMPKPNDWVFSLNDVTLSKRTQDDNDTLQAAYYARKRAGKPANWPPKDDVHAFVRVGMILPQYAELREQYKHIAFLFLPHTFSCLCWDSTEINDELAAIVQDKQPSFNVLRKKLLSLFKEQQHNIELIPRPIQEDEIAARSALECFKICVDKLIPQWCLHSYINNPEMWLASSGKMRRKISFFKKKKKSETSENTAKKEQSISISVMDVLNKINKAKHHTNKTKRRVHDREV